MIYKLTAKGQHVIIVRSEFNTKVTERLLKGAIEAFTHYKGLKGNLRIYGVPGALEIPGTVQQIIKYHRPDAIVALGAVIRGKTSHFNIVARESAHGISKLSRNSDIPIINGILTTDNVNQAIERSKHDRLNKGWNAMEAALHTISVYREIQSDF